MASAICDCFCKLALCLSLGLLADVALAQTRTKLSAAPSPIDNPLKGLVPYAGERPTFPHSMEFNYIGLAQIMKGYDQYDWTQLENLLNDIASRGHQAIIRIYLEYPGKTNVIPQFLIDDGLQVHRYLNTNTQPFEHATVETPDYSDPKLRLALKNFIAAFGKRYDADVRLAYITAGLLGTWGEWHTYPRDELFASKEVQREVMQAYQRAFKKNPVLLRYPAGPTTWGKAANDTLPFGYHDDSFAWATLDTGRKEDDWFYLPALKLAGEKAIDKWKTQPIGGEIRPEAWGKVFDADPGNSQIQDFRQCVDQTHVTWLMDSGLFETPPSPQRAERAAEEVRHMGYDFHVQAVTAVKTTPHQYSLKIEIVNHGVAPFYADWPMELGLIANQKLVWKAAARARLKDVSADAARATWQEEVNLADLDSIPYKVAIRVPNPLPNGRPVKFANASQDQDVPDWLTLCELPR